MGDREFQVVTLNVNGLTSPIERAKMIAKAKKEKSKIVLWQETHLISSEHEKLKTLKFRNTFHSSYKRGCKHRVAILISN